MSGTREQLLGVRLSGEWVDQYPVRVSLAGDDIRRGLPSEEFCEVYGVPADVGSEIDGWDREVQDRFRPDDPAESGFDDEETADRWVAHGVAVARRLAGLLHGIPVEPRPWTDTSPSTRPLPQIGAEPTGRGDRAGSRPLAHPVNPLLNGGRVGYECRMAELTVRAAVEGDFEEFMRVSSTAFLDEWVEREQWTRRSFTTHRFHVAVDGGPGQELVGTCGILGRRLTLPGAGPTPVAAVTAVTVKPGHRRRGALTAMMRTQLHGLHETGGEAVAALWASEAPIYGRFGYGRSAHFLSLDVPSDAPFRPGVDLGTDRVRQLPREEAVPLLAPVYDRVSAQWPGWLDRDELFWNMVLADLPERRQGNSELRFAVHPDGYAIFRTRRGWGERGPDGRIHVREVVAATPVAAAALWRHLLDYDLIGGVSADVAVDDPITQLLHDPRQAIAIHRDSLWVRLVDLDRALAQRRYSGAVDVVLEVTDGFCPWNAGRWRLTAQADGPVSAARSDDDADLRLDVADLGAAYLGGPTLVQLATAGRVEEVTPGALVPASRAFAGARAPHCPEVF